MKTILGMILFFMLFGWLGIGVVGIAGALFLANYFWWIVAVVLIVVFRHPLGALLDWAQGVPPPAATKE